MVKKYYLAQIVFAVFAMIFIVFDNIIISSIADGLIILNAFLILYLERKK